MIRFWYIGVCVLFLACTKDKGIIKKEEPVITKFVKPKVRFVFFNRLGYRGDSTGNGTIDTVFKGACFYFNYYDVKKNITFLNSSCFNRDWYDPMQRLSDYIKVDSFDLEYGNRFTFEIECVWKRNVVPYATKAFRYANKSWPYRDTLKLTRDTIIRFVWPDDTSSGKFVRTFKFP